MANIPLRTYNREIEGMIDRGQAAQAISHGRHILKFFPKHIDTYRLLGKAFLELQRYGEAADVLERVLACIPDDFISQIGMGIIREEEGNLDAAIWHMERAFEAQPSNVGVQTELRRLHGRRDGVEPPKIRLTRGALVRMYARGELFQQAIGEARAALAEDPQRADLEVILARMYFLSGQKVAATEVCTHLLERLPFCFEANRILAEILPGTTRSDDAKLYQQRVTSMDPYLAHLNQQITTPSEVPDNAVELEHLEWLSEQEVGQPSEWTKSLGEGWTDQAEPIPEWITGVHIEPQTEEPPVPAQETQIPETNLMGEMPIEEEAEQPEAETEPEEETQIPEWMQKAGWQPSTGEADETQPTEAVPEEPVSEDEYPIEQAEIPDWLAAIAPADQTSEIPEMESEKPDWLSDILSAGPEEETQPVEGEVFESTSPEPAAFTTEGDEEIPEGEEALSNGYPVEEPQATIEPSTEAEVPVPSTFAEEEPSFEETIPEEAPPQPPEEEAPVPEWLANMQAQQPESSEGAEEIPPSVAESTPGELTEILSTKSEEELPEWLQPTGIEPPAEESIEEVGAGMFQAIEPLGDTQPIQIKRDQQPVAEPEFSTEELQPEAEQPDQISAEAEHLEEIPMEAEQVEEIPSEVELESEVHAEGEQEEEIPWLESFDVDKRAEEESPIIPSSEEGEELADWIQEVMADQGALGETSEPEEQQEIPPSSSEETTFEKYGQEDQTYETEKPAAFMPEWLASEPETSGPAETEPVEAEPDLTEPQIEAETPFSEEQIEEIEEQTPSQPEPISSESDQGFAWLENLAAKQGVDEETLQVSPEQRQAEPPEWIKEQPEEVEPESAETPEPDSQRMEESVPDSSIEYPQAEFTKADLVSEEPQEVPSAFTDQEQSLETAESSEEADQAEEALPEWLRDLSKEEEPVAQEAPSEKAAETPEAAKETMGWLEELTLEEAGIAPSEQVEEPRVSPEPTLEAPSAFKEDENILEEEAPASTEALPDWLQGLDEEKSKEEPLPVFGEEGRPVSYEKPEKQEDWIPEMAAEAPSEEAADLLEDTSPVRVTPQPEGEASSPSDSLKRAQEALEAHNIERALELYDRLIQSGEYLEDTIHDLRDALYRYPIDVAIWQALGDACMKGNRLQEALDAYTKAEELLR